MIPPKSPPPCILVVDDDEHSADTLALLLHDELGCDVEIAYDGDQALQAAIARRPEAVVMDVDMPRMNGPETALLLRRAYPGMAPKLLAVTAHNLQAAANEALFDAHFRKPVPFGRLVEALAEVAEI